MSAVMLLDRDRPQSEVAERHARALIDVIQVVRHSRSDRRVTETLQPAKYLLNFLSAPRLIAEQLALYEIPINFHPAPPEYPGVGSASLALYDNRTTHGVTAHVMDERYDHGQVFRVRRFPIDPAWGYQALFNRSLDECLALFLDVIHDLSVGAPLRRDQSLEWVGQSVSRKQFEAHPAFSQVPA